MDTTKFEHLGESEQFQTVQRLLYNIEAFERYHKSGNFIQDDKLFPKWIGYCQHCKEAAQFDTCTEQTTKLHEQRPELFQLEPEKPNFIIECFKCNKLFVWILGHDTIPYALSDESVKFFWEFSKQMTGAEYQEWVNAKMQYLITTALPLLIKFQEIYTAKLKMLQVKVK